MLMLVKGCDAEYRLLGPFWFHFAHKYDPVKPIQNFENTEESDNSISATNLAALQICQIASPISEWLKFFASAFHVAQKYKFGKMMCLDTENTCETGPNEKSNRLLRRPRKRAGFQQVHIWHEEVYA